MMLKNYCRKLSMSSSGDAAIFFAAGVKSMQKIFVRSAAENSIPLPALHRYACLHIFPLPPSGIF